MNTILATLDANGWAVIIGAFFLGIGQIVGIVLAHSTKKAVNGALSEQNAAKMLEQNKLVNAVGTERFAAGVASEKGRPHAAVVIVKPPQEP